MFTTYKKYTKEIQAEKNSRFVSLAPECFEPDPNQPRKVFSEVALAELRESMEVDGQLQPILVLPPKKGEGKYRIVAGERRWRAACASKKIGRLDAVVRCPKEHELLKESFREVFEGSDCEIVLSDRLITLLAQVSENKRRENLSILDEASSYKIVVDELDGSLEKAGRVLGLSKSLLSKHLSLIKAEECVLSLSRSGLCQDVATLYTLNNLLKVNPERGESLIAHWQELVASGKNMRRLSEDSIREAKNAQRSASISAEPLVSEVRINKETFIYLLKITQGKTKKCFSLPAKQFQLLRRQVMQYDIS